MIHQLFATVLAVFALNAFAAVDANQASRADLETVKGIGPGLSAKIVEARKTGVYKNWGDLVERVGGIGSGNAGRLSQAGLTVAGSAFDAAAAVPASTSVPRARLDKMANADRSGKTGKTGKSEVQSAVKAARQDKAASND